MVTQMKRYYPATFLLFLCFLIPGQAAMLHGQSQKEWVIVIDPGHGGRDPGAVGGDVKEKDITLAIALKLGKQLATLENTRVVYTRTKDETVDLYKRPQIAMENKADLFISIHCNSVTSSKPYGAETWVMGLHRSRANLEVARKENAVILLEEDYQTKYDGFDPNSPEAEIIFSLYQNAYLDQSVEMASLVQHQLRNTAQRFDRGVKQAGFLVLWRLNMPAILIEAGFLSNENERKYLNSKAGQTTVANSIFSAVVEYRTKIDGMKPKVIGQTQTMQAEKTPSETSKPATQLQSNNLPQSDLKTTSTNATHTKPQSQQNTFHTKPQPELYYAVQFLSTSARRNLSDPLFNNLPDVHEYVTNGVFRYVSGYFQNLEQAIQHKNTFSEGQFQDAFVVAFHKGKRVTLSEAEKLQKP